MNPDDKLESLIEELKLPSTQILKPWLKHLVASPGSCVIIAIELPFESNQPRVAYAWLSEKERLRVRKALQNINQSRAKQGETPTTESPQ
jgi:hypothetical protein